MFPHELYPEYYLLKINRFDDIARDTLDEWIYFLKNEEIEDTFQAKGLKKAKEILDIMNLSEEERLGYESHMEDRRYQASMYQSTFVVGRMEGEAKGRAEGWAEGQVEGKIAVARIMKERGEPLEKILEYTRLTREEIE
uniref:PD-(D/E)XK nuclease family transposase n=1 Tax=Candidatus Kentrum sp. LPFa TaxID=2126335 RepID=A0A450WRV6_9GAMM|nr:MAG: conserved hypothetical protein (putative transposase or invertase) [Candidatus Kentron sp. LPFa]VFK34161.1 MAG: conserved hypothetical protein (putative transposase or invertase) [Candidatus Kentron sp. LPFa]